MRNYQVKRNNLIFRYIKYIFLSRHRKGHGVHSPALYKLISFILTNKIETGTELKIKNARQSVISNQTSIEPGSFGAGSRRKRKSKKVSTIAKQTGTPVKYGRILHNLVKHYDPGLIVELGTCLGSSTMYLAMANNTTPVYTIEGSKILQDIAGSLFHEAGIKNIHLVNDSFENGLNSTAPGMKGKRCLVFLDGDHGYEPTKKNIHILKDKPCEDLIVVIDDINWSKEMARAWDEIKKMKEVKASIDLFRYGIIWFNQRIINKTDYLVRY